MIAAEAPVLFARACEMFIHELTCRAWHSSDDTKRRTLQRSDIAAAIAKTDIFDFLVDIVPCTDPNIQPVAGLMPPPGTMGAMPPFLPPGGELGGPGGPEAPAPPHMMFGAPGGGGIGGSGVDGGYE